MHVGDDRWRRSPLHRAIGPLPCTTRPAARPPLSMAVCLAAHRAPVLTQAPGKQAQGAAALAPRARPRVLAARPQQRATARRAMTVTAMAASESSALLCWACAAALLTGGALQDSPLPLELLSGPKARRRSDALAGVRCQPTRAWRSNTSAALLRRAPRAELIDGKAIADDIRKELKAEVDALKAKYGKVRGKPCEEEGGAWMPAS